MVQSPRSETAPPANTVYDRLMAAAVATDDAPLFDAHVAASILALSAAEAETAPRRQPVAETAGFDAPDALIEMFPACRAFLAAQSVPVLVRSEEELCLTDLLQRAAVRRTPFEMALAGMVARRAQRPNHLWQDLGLRDRGELNRLMQTHFPALARRNRADMKWKKFFYRTLCRDADYTLCTAPSCSECGDFDACFSEETGECLLAHTRRKADLAA